MKVLMRRYVCDECGATAWKVGCHCQRYARPVANVWGDLWISVLSPWKFSIPTNSMAGSLAVRARAMTDDSAERGHYLLTLQGVVLGPDVHAMAMLPCGRGLRSQKS